ncbi:MAG: hypothetical protein MJ227_02675 [Bacilli bacterium]|nr:hypothetical protein [Bacilli bacterium]
MKLFKKREGITQNLAYMGIMAAINVLFVLLTTLVPYLLFLIVFVLPLTNCIVTLFCQKKYFPIYAIATISLCMVVTVWNISDTLFYVIPSIIVGFIFGILIEKNIPPIIIIFVTSLLNVALSYAFLPLTKLIAGVDLINVFASAFKVIDHPYLSYIAPMFIGFIAVTQSAFSYLVIAEELPKLGIKVNDGYKMFYLVPIGIASCLTLSLIFGFAYGPMSYFFMSFAMYFSIYQIIKIIIDKNKALNILLLISLIISIFVFAACYQYIANPLGLLLIGVWFIQIGIIGYVNNYLSYKKEKVKMFSEGNFN